MLDFGLGIEEVEVVVHSVVISPHAGPSEEEVEQSCRPERSNQLFIEVVDPVPLKVVLVETSVAEVEVKLLIVRIPGVSDETLDQLRLLSRSTCCHGDL